MKQQLLMHKPLFFSLTPFLVFASTYFFLCLWLKPQETTMPDITGMNLYEALETLSTTSLLARIRQYDPESTLPAGHICHTLPQPHTHIKKGQTVYITLAGRPAHQHAPSCAGLTYTQVNTLCKQHAITPLWHEQPSDTLPAGICLAQCPAPGKPTPQGTLICYLSTPTTKRYIWPSFQGSSLAQAHSFFTTHHIAMCHNGAEIATDNIQAQLNQCIVTAQQPRAGSVVTDTQLSQMQAYLHVKKQARA